MLKEYIVCYAFQNKEHEFIATVDIDNSDSNSENVILGKILESCRFYIDNHDGIQRTGSQFGELKSYIPLSNPG